jgi:dCMP deaminase
MRPPLDSTLMAIATVWEGRSTCSRNHVGVVIAKDGRHIGSGYNGAPAGMPHCEHIEVTYNLPATPPPPHIFPLAPANRKGCVVSIHAEANAIAYCARDGISVLASTIYCTLSPCYSCSQLIIASGIARVVYLREYRDPDGLGLLRAAGILVDRLDK